MADRIIQSETLQGIANALRGGASTVDSDKIDVTDFATKASETREQLKVVIDGSLSSIVIPNTTEAIRDHTFSGCTSLSSIDLSANSLYN